MPWNTALPGSVVVMCHHSTVTGLRVVAVGAGVPVGAVVADDPETDGLGVPPLDEHAPTTRAMTAAPPRSRCGSSFTIDPPSTLLQTIQPPIRPTAFLTDVPNGFAD